VATIDNESSDIVWGAAEIGRVIGKSKRQAFYLLEAGLLPGRKVGRQWCASRERLVRAVIGEESAA
jgi:hypothetical protein